MPYMELTKLCRERGVLVLLDGAHGPGQVALNLEELGQGGVDFFTGKSRSAGNNNNNNKTYSDTIKSRDTAKFTCVYNINLKPKSHIIE